MLRTAMNALAWPLLRLKPVRTRPVLVLGHDRSGTTWIGRTLGFAARALYVHEPLNPGTSRFGNWSFWNSYLRDGDHGGELARIFEAVTRGIPPQPWSRAELRTRFAPETRLVVKETGGMLCGEWFAKRYTADIVAVVRHPVPVVRSNLKQGVRPELWRDRLLAQTALMEDHLAPYREQLAQDGPALDVMARVWAARHRVFANQLARNKEWRTVVYETLCNDPLAGFQSLFENLGLKLDEAAAQRIRGSTETHEDGFFATRRVSSETADRWKSEAPRDDVQRIREVIRPFDLPYYSTDKDWLP